MVCRNVIENKKKRNNRFMSQRVVLLIICLLSFSATLAHAALEPSITVRSIRNFTRVSFYWPERVRFRIEPMGNAVTLTFNQPADIDTGKLKASLGSTLRGIDRSANGRQVTLRFDQPYRVRHFISGNANGIDILGATPKPAAPTAAPTPPPEKKPGPKPKEQEFAGLPLPTAKPASPLASTPEPPKPLMPNQTEADDSDTGDNASAVESAEVEESATNEVADNATAPPVITTAKPEEAEPAAPDNVLADKQDDEEADAPEIAATAPPPAEAVQVPADPFAPAGASEENATVKQAPAAKPAQATTPPPFRTLAAELAPPEESAPANTQQSLPVVENETTPAAPLSPADSSPPDEAAANQPDPQASAAPSEFDAFTADAPARSEPLQPVGSSVDVSDPRQGAPFLITTYSLATGTEIRFPWVERVASSVFMRGDYLWIIFDAERQIDMNRFQSILPASILSVEQLDVPGHMVLRLKTDGTVHAKTLQPKNSAQWWVTLSIYPQIPKQIIEMEPKAEGTLNPHLYFSSLQYADPVTITDPLIGDELLIVPYYNAGEGVYPERSFPEVTILPSAQGVAAVKKNDFVEAVQLRNGFRITMDDGMHISEDLPPLKVEELEGVSQSITWFPAEDWLPGEEESFYDKRRRLEHQLGDASDVRANSLRLKLAQLHLAEGLGNEALAWLSLIERNDPFFFRERNLSALRGAAYFLNNDYIAAKEAFLRPELDENREQELWLSALKIFEEERPRFDYTDFYPTYISKYPPKLREKLAILAADNYINRKSYSRALKTIDTIGNDQDLSEEGSPYVLYLLGKIAAENENINGAKEFWEPLTEPGQDRFVRATAGFALTNLLYNNGEIDLDEAIKQLEALRIVWRGDALELSMLNYLAELYTDNDNYLYALRAWQEILHHYPDSPMAVEVAQRMAQTFNYLFIEDGAKKLPPLQALATFYEFKELTPLGERGDQMIQSLANRLIDVDLLDRAAGLLEHQIAFRQEKVTRSRLGAQLAMVYLLDQQPEKALEKLELTGYGKMPESLALQRKRIAALAMSDIGATERALDMLSYDASRQADALRLNLYWKMRSWQNVIAMGESLLGSRPDITAPLTQSETEHALQLAIAYMFERNETQLKYLRDYFGPKIADGPNKDIFMFVTDVSGPIDPQRFEQLSQQISRFESFMDSYESKIEAGGISAMLN